MIPSKIVNKSIVFVFVKCSKLQIIPAISQCSDFQWQMVPLSFDLLASCGGLNETIIDIWRKACHCSHIRNDRLYLKCSCEINQQGENRKFISHTALSAIKWLEILFPQWLMCLLDITKDEKQPSKRTHTFFEVYMCSCSIEKDFLCWC